jgi:hypothetical protein
MLSEKKISNRGNNEDYFGEMSKTFGDMYDSIKSNKTFEPIQEQVNNLTKSSSEILGNTLNLNPDPFANPNPIPNQDFNLVQQPIQQNMSGLQSILSQGPQLTPQGPQMIPQGSQILPQSSQAIEQINEIPSPSSYKSIMNMIEEPSKTFSGVFSSESAKTTSSSDELFEVSESSIFENIITVILLFIFLILIGIYAIQYFYGIDIVAKIKNIFTNHPEIEIKVEQEKEPKKKDSIDNDVSQIMKKPQVFNIPENNYIYGDAQAVCKAYGSRLATYQEVEEAYNKGAEWCNYGWSEGQMALFPTQQKTFDELQKIEGHENDCGRPGINGGFIDNPKLKYGVNCYGYKPRINKIEKELMETSSIYPKTKKDIAMDKRVEYWKDRLSEIIVSPFNHDKWSKL